MLVTSASLFVFLASVGASELDSRAVGWSYLGACPPSKWASAGYTKCSGMNQSPIDLKSSTPVTSAKSSITGTNINTIKLDTAKVFNDGHTVGLVIPQSGIGSALMSGGLLVGNYQLHLLRFHWGSDDTKGSEHTIDGKRFPLEMHMVHVTTDIPYNSMNFPKPHGLFVATFMFQITASDNPAIAPIVNRIKNVMQPNTTTSIKNFKLTDLIYTASAGGYYAYDGSLTIPTCDEVVQWVVFKTPINISSKQLAQFRTAKNSDGTQMVNNFRPTQALNNRVVTNIARNAMK